MSNIKNKKEYYYLYEIKIDNSLSSHNGCFYYGKHCTNKIPNNYYGSGKIIQNYIRKYGRQGLIKTILKFYDNELDLALGEYDLILNKKKELGKLCLNLNDGGQGSFTYINYLNSFKSKEERHLTGLIGGLGMKFKLEDRDFNTQFRKKLITYHQNQTEEEKNIIYGKVSYSLKEYYKSDTFKKIQIDKNLKNKESNKISSKKWRSEFKNLFNCSPEKFRSIGKMKEALDLFKNIKDLPKEIQENEVNRFMESINRKGI